MTDETRTIERMLARAWEAGAFEMNRYHEHRNDWLTWEGMHRSKPIPPGNPYLLYFENPEPTEAP